MDEQLYKHIQHNKELAQLFYHDFGFIFGVHLYVYFDLLTGFDIVGFDRDVIKSLDNESISQAINRQYGNDGENLIKILLGM